MEEFILITEAKIAVRKYESVDNAIVFLHNSSGSMDIWDQQFNDPQFKDYSMICFDLPGHGKSSHSKQPEKDYTLPAMADNVLQILNSLSLHRYIIVAVSLSTNFVAEIADKLVNCEGIFMIGASVIGQGISPADILLPFEFGAALFEENPDNYMLDNYMRGLYYKSNSVLQEKLMRNYLAADARFRQNIGASIAKGEWKDETVNLALLRKNIAWIYGEKEQIINAGYLNKINISKWRNNIFSIPDAGHLAHLDQPEIFNRLLLEFAIDAFN
ncbi:MAG: alpha/beta hydrolase [Arachidicoccus sp.]|nr:alpha/beta hydrolase [Arachidicoccus sp.]